MEQRDLTLNAGGDGIVNLRVGALITRDGKFLMTGNPGADYLYSVGGRIRFGETAEEALRREVFEETGYEPERTELIGIHENFFTAKDGPWKGKRFHEISFYYRVPVPADFAPEAGSRTGDGEKEFLRWVDRDWPGTLYPAFFREAAGEDGVRGVRRIVTREWTDDGGAVRR